MTSTVRICTIDIIWQSTVGVFRFCTIEEAVLCYKICTTDITVCLVELTLHYIFSSNWVHRLTYVPCATDAYILPSSRVYNIFTRIISAPGIWLQHITTCEPDDPQIEVAIAALKPCIPENKEDDKW